MSFLRSSLFAALVSLLVLTGYGFDVLDYDCDDVKQEQAHGVKGAHGKKSEQKESGVRCLCHQVFTAEGLQPASVAPVPLEARESFVGWAEFAPETVPAGIDYPPQLS